MVIVAIILVLLTGAGYAAVKIVGGQGEPGPTATPTPAPGLTADERSKLNNVPVQATLLQVTELTADRAQLGIATVGTLQVNGSLTATGNGTFGGILTAANFQGNGAGLANVNAALLNGQPGSFYQQVSNLSGTVRDDQLPGGLARTAAANTFTAANTFNSNLTVGGVLNASGTATLSSLTLGAPLTVANGGTGLNAVTSGGILYGQGSNTLGVATPSSAGLCLLSGVADVQWGACSGAAAGVATLNGLAGVLSIANATGSGSTITLNDATTAAKGIASFNSTNFTVTGGAVNTIQSINTGATPTFAGINTNTITPTGAFTLGATGQGFTLQGNASSTITATGGGFTTSVGFSGTPTGAVTYNFDRSAPAGTYTICTTSALCAGYAASSGSGSYIQNQSASPQPANFYIQSTAINAVAAKVQAVAGQTADIFQVLNSTGTPLFQIAGNANYATLSDNLIIRGQGNNADTTLTVRGNSSQGGFDLLADFQSYDGVSTNTVARITNNGGLYLGNNTGRDGRIAISNGTYYGQIDTSLLTGSNQTYQLPNDSGTICISTGNCAGAGGGVTGAGTANRLTKFTATGSTVGDSTISDNGALVTTTANLAVQGGNLTVGTSSQLASLLLHDGSGQTTTLQAGNSTGNLTFILPATTGGANQCLKQSGTGNQLIWDSCDGGTGGSSATLQSAYDASTTPELTLDSTRGALTIRDASSPLGGNLLEVRDNGLTTTYLGVTTSAVTLGSNIDLLMQGATAYISNPQAQTNSEAFGLNATVGDANALAVGRGATASVQNATAVGYNASVSAGTNGTAIGSGASVISTNGVAVGYGAQGKYLATAVGAGSLAEQDSIALGNDAAVNGQRSVAIGVTTTVNQFDSIALGYGAAATAANQMVIGSASSTISSVRIGNGVTSATPTGFTLQGTSGSGSNIAGANVNIAAGQGTGTALGGSILFQSSLAGASGASLNALSTLGTLSTTSFTLGTNIDMLLQGAAAFISNPQTQTASEAFGASALVSGANALAVGNGAGAVAGGTAIGQNASVSGLASNGVAIGRNANVAGNSASVAVGYGSFAQEWSVAIGEGAAIDPAGQHAVALGYGTQAKSQSIALGYSADADNFGAIAMGYMAAATGYGASIALGHNAAAANWSIGIGEDVTFDAADVQDALAIGRQAHGDFRGIALGSEAYTTNGSIAIGYQATTNTVSNSIAIGNGAVATANNQLVIGSNSQEISQVVIGGGVTSTSPFGFTLQGTSGSGNNIAGASISIAAGQGTGNASGGNLNFQIAAPGASGTGLNSLATAASISGTDGSATFKNAANSATAFRVLNSGNVPLFTVDTAGTAVQIGSSTPDAVGALLILDSKTGTDPTGIAGAMYYNSDLARMRCYIDSRWQYCNDPVGLTYGFNMSEEFLSSATTNSNGSYSWNETKVGTGAGIVSLAPEANRPGIIAIDTGTTTTGANSIYVNSVGGGEPIIIAGGETIEMAINISALADVTNDYVLRLGLCDQIGTTDCTDGVYFEYDRSQSTNWRYATAAGAVRTKNSSTKAVATGWTNLKIVANSSSSVTFYIKNSGDPAYTSLGTISATVPSAGANGTQPEFSIYKTAGTTKRQVLLDYFQLRNSFTTAR